MTWVTYSAIPSGKVWALAANGVAVNGLLYSSYHLAKRAVDIAHQNQAINGGAPEPVPASVSGGGRR